MLRYDGQVAVITGAAGGLGLAYAELLIGRGAKVVLNDLGGDISGSGSDRSRAEIAAAELRSLGGEAVADATDVTADNAGEAIIGRAIDAFGRVDIVIHNAGISSHKPITEITVDDFRRFWEVNVGGAVKLTQAAHPHMKEQGGGKVVYTTSANGLYGAPGSPHYGSAKAALIGLMRAWHLELAPDRIAINVIAPGAISRMVPEGGAMHALLAATSPPELVAPVVAWLVHPECAVSGEVLVAIGGHTSRAFTAQTPGYANEKLTLEGVREHFAEIAAEDGYTVPTNAGHQITAMLAARGIDGPHSVGVGMNART